MQNNICNLCDSDEIDEFIRESMRQAACQYDTCFEKCDCHSDDCDDNGYLPVMAFVPAQSFGRTYNEAQALNRGTLFPVLDKPFRGRGGKCCG